jgi:ABC-type Mn2+/Zn2+ transport system ATPase subunit
MALNKRIVIIAGPNGAGKTTFARAIGVSIAIVLLIARKGDVLF